MTRLCRRKAFHCLHRYSVAELSAGENLALFGACFTPHGHGHNYELEAYFEGPIDPLTGMIVNLVDVDRVLDEVLAPLAGKHLNFEVAEFKNRVPTTEALAHYLTARLQSACKFAGVKIAKLRLYECDDLWVDVWP